MFVHPGTVAEEETYDRRVIIANCRHEGRAAVTAGASKRQAMAKQHNTQKVGCGAFMVSQRVRCVPYLCIDFGIKLKPKAHGSLIACQHHVIQRVAARAAEHKHEGS